MLENIILPESVASITGRELLIWVVFIVTTATALRTVRKRTLPFATSLRLFLEDWTGRQERPGFEGHPGVMQRLSVIENQVTSSNSTSLHDKVSHIDTDMAILKASTASIVQYLSMHDPSFKERIK